jgi:hypothetical protein
MTDPRAADPWDLTPEDEPDSLEAADPMVFIRYRELYLEDADTLVFDWAMKGHINDNPARH